MKRSKPTWKSRPPRTPVLGTFWVKSSSPHSRYAKYGSLAGFAFHSNFAFRSLQFPLYLRRVVGDSMLPALPAGQVVIATSLFRHVNTGDTVIIYHDGLEKIKRVDRVTDCRIYVLGDNPSQSTDSRHFGWLEREQVSAKVVWPRSI